MQSSSSPAMMFEKTGPANTLNRAYADLSHAVLYYTANTIMKMKLPRGDVSLLAGGSSVKSEREKCWLLRIAE